jgi:hypothetical protein
LTATAASDGENRSQDQVRHALEMPQVSGHQLEVVLERRSRDLQVGVGQHSACAFQARPSTFSR